MLVQCYCSNDADAVEAECDSLALISLQVMLEQADLISDNIAPG